MQIEEWISLNEYMRRFKVGYEVALQMIHNKEVEYRKTPGGRYKIKVGGNTVSSELHESIVRENAELKATIKIMQSILQKVKI